MLTTTYTSPGRTLTTYSYYLGSITWDDGQAMNAVLIDGIPVNGGSHADRVVSIVANRILADHPEVSAPPSLWGVFVRTPAHWPGAGWRLAGTGSTLPEHRTPAEIPESVIPQLDEILAG